MDFHFFQVIHKANVLDTNPTHPHLATLQIPLTLAKTLALVVQ